MRFSAVLCSVLVAGGVIAAQADVYRWVDSSGSVHYSDVPVEGAVRIISTTPRTEASAARSDNSYAATARERMAVTDGSIQDRLSQEGAARAVQDDIAKKRAEQCKQATTRYEQAITARRLYKQTKGGERVYLNDAEIDQARVQARTERDTACGSPKR